MSTSKNYMLLFRFEPDFDYKPSAEELKEQQASWGGYIGNMAIQEKLVATHRLGFEGTQIDADKNIKEVMHMTNGKIVSGNMVIRAQSFEEALAVAKESPILSMAGGHVEVREIMPM